MKTLTMKSITHKILPSLAAGILFTLASPSWAAGYVASLVDDFDINTNSAASTWSYSVGVPGSNYLLPINTKTVSDIFSPPAWASAQQVWADNSPSWAYWMIGKNTTGATITGPIWGDTLNWQPDTIMLYPGNPTQSQNLLVSWLAPSDMMVDLSWTYTQLAERGPGREAFGSFGTVYRVTHRSSTGDTTLVDFGAVAGPNGILGDTVSSSLSGLSVMAGDRLFWETKGFNSTADCDATGAAIVIAESIPEPATTALLALGCGIAVLQRRRKC